MSVPKGADGKQVAPVESDQSLAESQIPSLTSAAPARETASALSCPRPKSVQRSLSATSVGAVASCYKQTLQALEFADFHGDAEGSQLFDPTNCWARARWWRSSEDGSLCPSNRTIRLSLYGARTPMMSEAELPSHYFMIRPDVRSAAGIVHAADETGATVSKTSDPAATLPSELIQAIYVYLGPTDFNAARRTCRSWMAASLNYGLLIMQLKRGGWWTAAARACLIQTWRHQWPMSCFLARECALAGDWTGLGVDTEARARPCLLRHTGTTEFTDLETATSKPSGVDDHSFVITTSQCGEYCLVAVGSTIYVHKLEGATTRQVSEISCERKVIAMSMYATEKRCALAALLEGRIGIYVDVYGGVRSSSAALP